MAKGSFIFYESWLNVIRDLPSDVQLEIYQATAEYAINGNLAELKPMARVAFSFIKQDIDRDTEKYISRVEASRENGKKGAEFGKLGGRPKKEKPLKTPNGVIKTPKTPDNVDVDDDVNEDDNVLDNSSVEGEKGFSPPPTAENPNAENSDLENPTKNETEKRKKVPPKKEKKPIEQRAKDFKKEIWAVAKGTDYKEEAKELRKFWEYWSEHGSRDKRMRYEKEQSFSISRRLGTWFANVEKDRIRNYGSKDTRHSNPNQQGSEATPKKLDYSGGF